MIYNYWKFWEVLFDGWLLNKSNVEEKLQSTKDKLSIDDIILVPNGWEKYPKEKIVSLARDLTGEKYLSKVEAVKAIKKVIQGKN